MGGWGCNHALIITLTQQVPFGRDKLKSAVLFHNSRKCFRRCPPPSISLFILLLVSYHQYFSLLNLGTRVGLMGCIFPEKTAHHHHWFVVLNGCHHYFIIFYPICIAQGQLTKVGLSLKYCSNPDLPGFSKFSVLGMLQPLLWMLLLPKDLFAVVACPKAHLHVEPVSHYFHPTHKSSTWLNVVLIGS